MRNRYFKLICFIILSIIFVGLLYWYNRPINEISQIEMYIVLNDDGSAKVTQKWTGDLNKDTDLVLPFIDLQNSVVSNLAILNGNKIYSSDSDFLEYETLIKKAFKYKIVNNNGVRTLHFGISEYGKNEYTIEYILTDFVKNYADGQGVIFNMLPGNIEYFNGNVNIYIRRVDNKPLTKDIVSFEYLGFLGEQIFLSNEIKLWSTTPFLPEDFFSLKMVFNEPIFNINSSVENSNVVNNNISDSKLEDFNYVYDNIVLSTSHVIIVLCLIIIFIIAVALIFIIKYKASIKEVESIKEESEEVSKYYKTPERLGKTELLYVLGSRFEIIENENAIIFSSFVKLIIFGYINCLTQHTANNEKKIVIKFIKKPDNEDETIKSLFNFLLKVADNKGHLFEDKLQKYCSEDVNYFFGFKLRVKNLGDEYIHCCEIFENNVITNDFTKLKKQGKILVGNITGFKIYVTDLVSVKKEEFDVNVDWRNVIYYATLFGNEDNILKAIDKNNGVLNITEANVKFVRDMIDIAGHLTSLCV